MSLTTALLLQFKIRLLACLSFHMNMLNSCTSHSINRFPHYWLLQYHNYYDSRVYTWLGSRHICNRKIESLYIHHHWNMKVQARTPRTIVTQFLIWEDNLYRDQKRIKIFSHLSIAGRVECERDWWVINHRMSYAVLYQRGNSCIKSCWIIRQLGCVR